MTKKIIDSQVNDFESVAERSEDDKSADLIITLTPDIRVLVYHSKKEYVLEEFISRLGSGVTKSGKEPMHAKGEQYGEWKFFGSYGNIQQATKRAAECLVHGRLKAQKIATLKEYISEIKLANSDLDKIIGGITG